MHEVRGVQEIDRSCDGSQPLAGATELNMVPRWSERRDADNGSRPSMPQGLQAMTEALAVDERHHYRTAIRRTA
jgi:hypothetical protein